MLNRTAGVLWSTAMMVVAIGWFLENGHKFSLMSGALGMGFAVWLWYLATWLGNRRMLHAKPGDEAGDVG